MAPSDFSTGIIVYDTGWHAQRHAGLVRRTGKARPQGHAFRHVKCIAVIVYLAAGFTASLARERM